MYFFTNLFGHTVIKEKQIAVFDSSHGNVSRQLQTPLFLLDQGQIVRKPVSATPGLKVNRSVIFSLYKNVLHCSCFV